MRWRRKICSSSSICWPDVSRNLLSSETPAFSLVCSRISVMRIFEGLPSLTRVLLLLELFGQLQLTFRVIRFAQVAIALPQQMVRDRIVRVHGHRALQGSHREGRLSFLLEDLAHQDERPGRSGIQPDRTLQEALGLIVLLHSRVGIRELVIG